MTKPDIKALLKLARIDISQEEAEKLATDSEAILAFVETIGKASGDVDMTPQPGVPMNVFREDKNPHEPGLYTEALLANAPARQGNYVKVKKIL
jgi:aspartyl-tRNA(Asn)/glutamyl-tRNA(Gln) amidotransferase subunit C